MKIKHKFFATRYRISEQFKKYCKETKSSDGYELEPSPINFISWYDNYLNSLEKSKKETLSDKEYHFGLESPFAYGFKSSDIKIFVQKQLERINHEQELAKEKNHKRSLLFLKGELENDIGDLK